MAKRLGKYVCFNIAWSFVGVESPPPEPPVFARQVLLMFLVLRLLPCVSQADFVMTETPEISWSRRHRPVNPLWYSRLLPMTIHK